MLEDREISGEELSEVYDLVTPAVEAIHDIVRNLVADVGTAANGKPFDTALSWMFTAVSLATSSASEIGVASVLMSGALGNDNVPAGDVVSAFQKTMQEASMRGFSSGLQAVETISGQADLGFTLTTHRIDDFTPDVRASMLAALEDGDTDELSRLASAALGRKN